MRQVAAATTPSTLACWLAQPAARRAPAFVVAAERRALSHARPAHAEEEPTAEKKAKSAEKATRSQVGGPIGQLIKAFNWVKDQVTEDSVHYEKSKAYQAPVDRRRSSIEKPSEAFQANEDETGIVMHKESRWESQWNSFKENNPVLNRIFDLQMKYDESDNVLVRGARSVTDTLTDRLGQVFENDESGAVLAEVQRLDPTFDRLAFTLHCEKKVIPAVLEAFIAGDKEVLKEWCAEVCFNNMAAQIDQREASGIIYEARILDIADVEYITAQRMDEGPVLVFVFNAQQTHCIRDRTGAVVEGSEDNIQQSMYMFAMRRNPAIFDPKLAWQVLEMNLVNSTPVW